MRRLSTVKSATSVRFLTGSVALMHGDGTVLLPWQSHVVPSRHSLQTFVSGTSARRRTTG